MYRDLNQPLIKSGKLIVILEYLADSVLSAPHRTRRPMFDRVILNIAFCTSVLILQACNGGSSEQQNSAAVDAPLSSTAITQQANVVFEQRSGKLAIDAWFSDTKNNAADSIGIDDHCELDKRQAVENTLPPSNEISTTSAVSTTFKEPIAITSITGVYATLLANTNDQQTYFASEKRSHTIALPDDAMLTLEHPNDSTQTISLPIKPIQPIEILTPSNRLLDDPSTTLTWNETDSEETHVKLSLKYQSGFSAGAEYGTIDCVLIDDGQFILPAEMQELLIGESEMTQVFMHREKITTTLFGDMRFQQRHVAHTPLL